MASPTIESLCCISSSSHFSNIYLMDFQSTAYNITSIVASLMAVGGGLYQIGAGWQNSSNVTKGDQSLKIRNKLIIMWLAAADLMAAIGIMARSVSWLIDKNLQVSSQSDPVNHVFCIGSSAWIHYFYTVTYAWTFIYALDVKKALEGKRNDPKCYHIFAWTVSAVLCLIGLLFLYLPDLNCQSSMANPYLRFLPNYLSTFIPILFVMIVNPILYLTSFSSVENLLTSNRGRFTDYERQIIHNLKIKFLMINVVFFVCWLPNILNGILLWTAWDLLPKNVLVTLWFMMAILNPLQAVLNCFVYRSWNGESPIFQTRAYKTIFCSNSVTADQRKTNQAKPENATWSFLNVFRKSKSPEKTPLLILSPNETHKR